MRRPRSYTGEDVVELHVPGSPAVTSAIIASLLKRGVRIARPGEFTERAYLCGRIDLAQAEAVLKIIGAQGEGERRAALAELDGALSRRTGELDARLLELLTQTELALDFSEDDVPAIESAELHAGLVGISAGIEALLDEGVANVVFAETPRVSLIGRANVGKSSLFNRLLDGPRAIVTDLPGTTRDVLEEEVVVSSSPLPPGEGREREQDEKGQSGEGREPKERQRRDEPRALTVLLVDTAGEKSAEEDVDVESLRRARRELERCDLPVLVLDGSAPLEPVDRMLLQSLAERPAIVVLNKIDLETDDDARRLAEGQLDCPCPASPVRLSCLTGEGIERLRREIIEMLTHRAAEGTSRRFLLNLRQRDALLFARDALVRADEAASAGMGLEFAAAEMRTALDRLRELTHPLDPDEILDAIFSRFCIGK